MLPVLAQFSVGGADITVRAYSTCLLVAAVAAAWLFFRAAAAMDVSGRRSAILLAGGLALGLAGARGLDAVLNPTAYARDPALLVTTDARGFALYGGLAGGAAFMLLAARRLGVDPRRLADAAVPAVAVGIAIVRIGCFLNGCCAGIATTLPWGVRFPAGGSAWSGQLLSGSTGALFGRVNPVHPTQLYELVAVLACAWLSGAIARRRPLPAGGRALLFAAAFLAFRALNQTLRAPTPGGAMGPWAVVAAYAAGAGIAAVLLAARVRQAQGRPLAAA